MPEVVTATLIGTRVRHDDDGQVSLGVVRVAQHYVVSNPALDGSSITYEVDPEQALVSVHFDSGVQSGTDRAFVISVDEDGAIVHDDLANDD